MCSIGHTLFVTFTTSILNSSTIGINDSTLLNQKIDLVVVSMLV